MSCSEAGAVLTGTVGGTCSMPVLSLAKAALGVVAPSFVAFVALDLVWLKFIAAKVYQRIKPIIKEPVDVVAAVGSWSFIVLGCYLFATAQCPTLDAPDAVAIALGRGALYGAITYGIYDFTNTATIAGWSWSLALVDIAWGTFCQSIMCLLQVWLKSCWLNKWKH